jgi:hypothetical protein
MHLSDHTGFVESDQITTTLALLPTIMSTFKERAYRCRKIPLGLFIIYLNIFVGERYELSPTSIYPMDHNDWWNMTEGLLFVDYGDRVREINDRFESSEFPVEDTVGHLMQSVMCFPNDDINCLLVGTDMVERIRTAYPRDMILYRGCFVGWHPLRGLCIILLDAQGWFDPDHHAYHKTVVYEIGNFGIFAWLIFSVYVVKVFVYGLKPS